MLQPKVHEKSKYFWFRRRVPAKYLKFGMPKEVKFSLDTTDRAEAEIRCNEMNLALERQWRAQLVGRVPDEVSRLQLAALAGEFYRETVAAHRDNPGTPIDRERSLRTLERRRRRLTTLIPLDFHLRVSFGDEARAFLERHNLFLTGDVFDAFIRDFVAAKRLAEEELLENAKGKYGKNEKAADYPEYQPTNPKRAFETLWDEFCEAKQIAPSTRKKWKPYFSDLIHRAATSDMSKITEKHLLDWRDALMSTKLSKITIRDGHIAAAKSFFGWAKRMKKLGVDPAADVVVEVSDKHGKKMRGFTDGEAVIILSAALAPMSELMSEENAAARRWVPWVCAYTGARVNEITQLRASDVVTVEGVPCIRITPEAGTVKTSNERLVPIHPHLLEQGFLKFAHAKRGKTPLFYSVERQRKPDRKNPTYTSVGNKLADWVRGLGIEDPSVMPNHGWRHRFKTSGRKAKMDWLILDAIQGHAPRTEGEGYGEVTPDVMLSELLKHPRYEVVATLNRDRRRRAD